MDRALARYLLALALAGHAIAQIDPAYLSIVTLYHETQPKFQSLGLRNQDTGDLLGDAYFVLRGLSLPVECASKNPLAGFDCRNPEENGTTTNVVSMNRVAIDNRTGPYGSCNVDERTATYSCSCEGMPRAQCNASVGRADVAAREIGHRPRGPQIEAWQWWRVNLAVKTKGNWYSTTPDGECTPPALPRTPAGEPAGTAASASARAGSGAGPCYWRLEQTIRTIEAGCLLTRVAEAITRYSPGCFQQCPQPSNISSTCVVECFMSVVLGPNGGKGLIDPTDGIKAGVLEAAWEAAFHPVANGGCPDPPYPKSRPPPDFA